MRVSQKNLIQTMAQKFGKKVKHDFGFESLFEPWHSMLTLDLAFCRSINFEFVLKSKINQHTTDSGGDVSEPNAEASESQTEQPDEAEPHSE